MSKLEKLLMDVKSGEVSVEDAAMALKLEPYEDLGYAKPDLHRCIRQGANEVIYGEGKTAEQILGILEAMCAEGVSPILVTRVDEAKAAAILEHMEAEYNAMARTVVVGARPLTDGIGRIVIATGGTSDMAVAEEAAVTAEFLGNEVVRLYDVGVAGLHRLMSYKEEIMGASVVIAVAGMEGALASVIGGMVDCPVVACPTSVGYGSSFGGVAALLSMLNSCANGIAVVNIDNGFGAGYMASKINHMSK